MARIVLPNNGTTISLNGERVRDLAEGDFVTITFSNPRTSRVNSDNGGVTIADRVDGGVAVITVSVQKHGAGDTLLAGMLGSVPLTVIEGSIKSRYFKDGQELTETYTVTSASMTDQPVETKNNQDGNAMLTYTFESRDTQRVV